MRIDQIAKGFRIAAIVLAISVMGLLAYGAQLPEQALNHANPRVLEAMEVQEEATPELMSMPDVLGTAVGEDDDGEPTILVFVNIEGKNPAATARSIPKSIKGKTVTVHATEPFRAMGKPAGSTAISHTAKQAAPIQLGTSGGWRYDLANGYCCGGTLGALIQKGGKQYILSNYHVFEGDIVSGGNSRASATGDPIIQPGLIDANCSAANAQNVATLEAHRALPEANVDASVAEVTPGMVRADGSILEIGTISSQTLAASVGMNVKKSGRTTGLTRSKIAGLNATISVQYEDECGSGRVAFTHTFTGQIVISNKGSRFLNSGDSGSLMVQDVATNPKAVGLLFAGSSSYAIANPINEVLNYFGAAMVGK